jgi:polygalacturonase
MSLTKVSYSMIAGAPVNALDYGTVGTGLVDDGPAIQLAVNAAAAAGGSKKVSLPVGSFLITTAVTLPSNIEIFGAGESTILIGVAAAGVIFNSTSKSNIVIRDIKTQNENAYILFTLCNKIRISNVYGQGLRTVGADFSQYAYLFNGCVDVLVENPTLDNYNNYLYFGISGATPCTGYAVVRGGLLGQSNATHGTTLNNPVGVYQFECANLLVDGVVFSNIKSSVTAPAPFYGFGVYEGDGTAANIVSTTVVNCHFINDDGINTQAAGVTSTFTKKCIVANNTFDMAGKIGFIYGSRNTLIDGNIFNNALVQTGLSGSGSDGIFTVSNNKFINTTGQALIMGNTNNGGSIREALINGNTFEGGTVGAMWMRFVTYAEIMNNVITDGNSTASANDYESGGINFFGCTEGFVSGNIVRNLTASGLNKFGVCIANPTHAVNVTSTNRFQYMVTSSVKNALTAPPTAGTWQQGEVIHAWLAAAGSVPGFQCVTAGAPGTWKAMAALAA